MISFIHDSRRRIYHPPSPDKTPTQLAMRGPCLYLVALIGIFASIVSSTALTYKLTAGEKSCFYAWVNEKGVKVAFYFAVSQSRSTDPGGPYAHANICRCNRVVPSTLTIP